MKKGEVKDGKGGGERDEHLSELVQRSSNACLRKVNVCGGICVVYVNVMRQTDRGVNGRAGKRLIAKYHQQCTVLHSKAQCSSNSNTPEAMTKKRSFHVAWKILSFTFFVRSCPLYTTELLMAAILSAFL